MNDLEIEVIYLEQQNSKLQWEVDDWKIEAENWEEKYKDVTNNFNDLDKLYNGVEQQCIIQQASIEKQAYIIEMLNKEIEKLKEEKELIYQVITVNNDKKESWE